MEFQVGNNVEHFHEVPSRNLLIEADSGCDYLLWSHEWCWNTKVQPFTSHLE